MSSLTAEIVAGVAVTLGALVTAAGSVLAALVTTRHRRAAAAAHEDLLAHVLAIRDDLGGVKVSTQMAMEAVEHVEAVTRDHVQVDERVWAWLQVPATVLRPVHGASD